MNCLAVGNPIKGFPRSASSGKLLVCLRKYAAAKIQNIPTRHFAPQNARRRDIAGASAEAHFFYYCSRPGREEIRFRLLRKARRGAAPFTPRDFLKKIE